MEALWNNLDRIMNDLLKQWNVPGISIALIQDGKILDVRGYGKRDLEQDLPMTGDGVRRKAELRQTGARLHPLAEALGPGHNGAGRHPGPSLPPDRRPPVRHAGRF